MDLSPATIVKILTDVTGVLSSTQSLHQLLVSHQEEAAALIPILENLGEGPSALAAAEKAAPGLANAIKNFVGSTNGGSTVGPKKAENLVRSLGGIGPMTAAQEAAWMASKSPDGDSASGSA
jgi:hypothetical protein